MRVNNHSSSLAERCGGETPSRSGRRVHALTQRAPPRRGSSCTHPDGTPEPAASRSTDARARSMNARPYICSAACWLCPRQSSRIPSARWRCVRGEAVAVIEFQGACLTAPAAMLVGERAAAAVALEDLALDGVRDVTRNRCVRVFGRSLSRLQTRGESLLLDLFDQHVECFLEDRRQVSVGNAVPEKVPQLAELLTTRATRGELELEGVLSERSND